MKKSLPEEVTSAYLKSRPLFYAFLRPQEAVLFNQFLPFKKLVLDFGCGDGFFASVAFKKQGKIDVGVDVDKKIEKEAVDSNVYEKVVIYDGKRLPFASESFNSIVSNCVLEHVPDLESCLSELHRVLKKGGRMYLTVVTNQWQKNLLGGKVFGDLYRNWFKKIQRHYNLLSQGEWEAAFCKHGLITETAVPYMTQKQQGYCEVFHYLDFTSLITRKLCGKWKVVGADWPGLSKFVNKLPISHDNLSCLFFVIKK